MVDLQRLQKAVNDCDVFTIGFVAFPERLLVDSRPIDEATGPMVTIVDPVQTVEERFFWLGQQRPKLGPPEKFTFFIWPHSIAFFESQGITDEIRQRCLTESWTSTNDQINSVMKDLSQLEEQAVKAAVSGDSYYTVWPSNK